MRRKRRFGGFFMMKVLFHYTRASDRQKYLLNNWFKNVRDCRGWRRGGGEGHCNEHHADNGGNVPRLPFRRPRRFQEEGHYVVRYDSNQNLSVARETKCE